MPHKPRTKTQPTQSYGRIRAFRHHDIESQLERSRALLGLGNEFDGADSSRPQRLARALRLARRAARGGSRDYDPARHLVLVRCLRALALPGSNEAGKIRKKSRNAREDV